ncbi:MAG TPA: ATP-binding protein, partial [Solirubrobacteraceae bacterium]|nr:ATP-binding protein [Solirubrobacteraceae bacterium]
MEPRAQAFAGRAAELGTLEQALAVARAGRGAAILVAGEAGIGKTRLAAEITGRAREAGWQTLLGRSIDLVGTELPYQPFAEALRPIGGPRPAASSADSQLQVFEETLALLTRHASATPLLLVLEDLHWADTSTLDLVVFLAHHLAERPAVLLATYRQGEPSSKGRMARLADGVRRSGSGLVLDLGPLPPEDLAALLATASAAALTPALADAIVARSGGNPFFAEELLAAGGNATAGLPPRLRVLLLGTYRGDEPASKERMARLADGVRRSGAGLVLDLGPLPTEEL